MGTVAYCFNDEIGSVSLLKSLIMVCKDYLVFIVSSLHNKESEGVRANTPRVREKMKRKKRERTKEGVLW